MNRRTGKSIEATEKQPPGMEENPESPSQEAREQVDEESIDFGTLKFHNVSERSRKG